ncbi:MAG: cytochrome c3 family protein [Pyrinomonadaceae bacterium]
MKTEKTSFSPSNSRHWSQGFKGVLILIFAFSFFGYSMVSCSLFEKKETTTPLPKIEKPKPSETPLVKVDPNLDFSKFKHSNEEHLRLPCSLCHVREDNSATPKFAKHETCSGCHKEQFEDKKSTICSICHTDAESGAMKGFGGLKSFNASFDHAKHTRSANCTECHRPTKGSVSFSIPTRSNSHATCFQCHSAGKEIGGKDISSCQTCHSPGNPPPAVPTGGKAFSLGFSHAFHKMACTSCHSVKAGASRGRQISSITPAMHFPKNKAQSCAACHNNQRAFGGDDFADCKRCHKGEGFNLR